MRFVKAVPWGLLQACLRVRVSWTDAERGSARGRLQYGGFGLSPLCPGTAAVGLETVTKTRVAHFAWTGEIGGAERALYQLVAEQVRCGEYEVAVVYGRGGGTYADRVRDLGCQVIDLGMRGSLDVASARAHESAISRYGIHHFHVMEPSVMSASVRCREAVRVFTQRGGRTGAGVGLRKQLRRAIGGHILRGHFSGVSGNTRLALDVARRRYRLEGIPMAVTYNGIDFDLLRPKRSRSAIREELGVGEEAFLVGSCGRFKSWKRFERLARATGPLRDVGAHVVLIGDGAEHDRIVAAAKSVGGIDRLHVTGIVADACDYTAALDAFVLPSNEEESFGNAAIEAMALGVASIVFADSPGVCEHIENGVSGFIVGDEAEMVQMLLRLAGDAQLRRCIGDAGSAHVRTTYTTAHMLEGYESFYRAATELGVR